MLLSSAIGALGQGISNWITRKREDTAVQRRAADMEAAGINPTLAAGSPAQAQPLKGALTEGADKAALAMSMMKMKADIGLIEAQRDNVKADTSFKQTEADVAAQTAAARVNEATAKAAIEQFRYEAESMIRTWQDTAGGSHTGRLAELRAQAEGYDRYLKGAEANSAGLLLKLREEAYNMVQSGGVPNPEIQDYLSKAIAYKLYQEELEHYHLNLYGRMGAQALGTAANAYGKLKGF